MISDRYLQPLSPSVSRQHHLPDYVVCDVTGNDVHAPITETVDPAAEKQAEEEDSMEGSHTVSALLWQALSGPGPTFVLSARQLHKPFKGYTECQFLNCSGTYTMSLIIRTLSGFQSPS